MIRINLLPEELRKIERVRKVKVNIAVIASLVAAVAVIIIAVALFVVGQRMRRIQEMKRRLAELEPRCRESEMLAKRKIQISKEIGMIEGFSSRRILWHKRLNEVSDALPDDLYLVKVHYASRAPAVLTIQGEALPGHGIEKVIEFIDTLRRIQGFARSFPKMDYSIESLAEGRKSFEIRCSSG